MHAYKLFPNSKQSVGNFVQRLKMNANKLFITTIDKWQKIRLQNADINRKLMKLYFPDNMQINIVCLNSVQRFWKLSGAV